MSQTSIGNWNPQPVQSYGDWNPANYQGGTQGGSQGGYTMPTDASFNYPAQWAAANNIFNRYGTGQGVNTTPLWGAMQKQTATARDDAIKQVAEQMGMGGNRWSSVALRSGQDVSGRLAQESATDWANKSIQAQENARLLAMQAGQNLQGLGSSYSQLPIQVAQQMQGMAGTQANEWQRTQPEYSPWLQYGMNMTQQTPQYAPQTYQPSWLSQGLGAASSMYGNYLGNQGQSNYGYTNPGPSNYTNDWYNQAGGAW